MANSLKAMIFVLIAMSGYSTITLALTTERIVVESSNGLAISGYDPVSFHLDSEPRLGSNEIEMVWKGAIWVFATPVNRDAFKENPSYYMPVYGGYDPTSLAEGRITPGNPRYWMKNEDKVYLFFSQLRRDRFAANPNAFIRKSEEIWPELKPSLRY